ncbi:hypothetical protein, conserved [Plasmodium vivax]|uniref:VIR protein n=1 Tax=Plasmodium vivax TaxID=5855 RepID=A0A1G4EIW9_PLAVI|nr:hypothetical protein, conserved [Plasmodium vivax]
MFSRRIPTYSSAINTFKQFISIDCTQKYNKYKNEIKQKISLFNYHKRTNFKKEWDRINKFIIDKNNEITDCVTNKYISVDFYGDPDIKNFSEICTSDDQLQKSTSGRETQNVNVSTETQLSTAHPVHSVAPKVRVPEQSANPVSRSSGLEDAQKQSSDVSYPPNEDKLGTEPRNAPLETTFIQEFNPSYSSQEKGTDENVPQSNLPSDHQANVELVVQTESHSATPSSHIHGGASNVEGDPSDVNSANRVSTSAQHNGLDPVNGTPHEHLGGEPTTRTVPIIVNNTDGVPLDNKDETGEDSGKLITDDEHAHVKTLSNEIASTQAICNGDTCIRGQDNELVPNNDNDLGMFSDMFQMIISNQDNMTKASIPIGIVLLLTLLFKYTPLWRVLSKKNKKKPAEMNQELHSVLQEPSILDEERSIPFSYGSFEYSS